MSGIFFILAILFSIYPHNIFQDQKYQKQTGVKGIHYVKPTQIPTSTPTPTVIYQTPTTQTVAASPTISHPTTNQTATVIPTTTQPTQSPTQASSQTVSMHIIDPIDPDGTNNFMVNLHSGNTICDSLQEAKSEGKIQSVSMTWYQSFNSYYVTEINGFSNNWTFTVDGQSPQGCSLYTPKAGDTIVWKYN